MENADRLASRKGTALSMVRARLLFVLFLFFLGFGAVTARVTYLCLWRTPAEPKTEVATTPKDARDADTLALGRADLIDRNGVLLATMVDSNALYADPKDVTNPKALAKKLVHVFPELDEKELTKKLGSKSRFVWIKRGLTPDESKAIDLIGDPALNVRNEPRRFYPQGELTAHLVGYVSVDNKGQAGIERGIETQIETAAKPVTLSVDVRIQHALRRALQDTTQKFHAKAAFGTVMDIHTGEILAAVSLPDYDPNHVADPNSRPMFSGFGQGVYELGSTFKLLTAAAYLQHVQNSLNQTFETRYPLKRGRFTIKDLHAKPWALSLPEIIAYSSNIGTALMGDKLGHKYVDFLNSLHVLEPLHTEISETANPQYSKAWRPIEISTATYGHGLATSVLHLSRAIAALCNDGKVVKPTFLKTDTGQFDEKSVISPAVSENLRKLMRLVVTSGSGRRADVEGYMVGGKTGTSDKNAKGGYDTNRRMSSFVGAFPMNAPRYVIEISVDEPQGQNALGAYVGAPAMQSVVKALVDLYAISPVDGGADERYAAAVRPYMKEGVTLHKTESAAEVPDEH